MPISIGQLVFLLGLCAVASSAAAAVLEAGRKKYDLFGVIIVAIAGALGGGSLRDILLGRPVFWVHDQIYLVITLLAALATFFLARRVRWPARLFLLPDALGLALFVVIGTRAALMQGSPWLVATFMGVITGVMGGVIRDVLCNEDPLVFQGPLYATAAWLGALLYVALHGYSAVFGQGFAELVSGCFIFGLRLAALHWNINLPKYRTRET